MTEQKESLIEFPCDFPIKVFGLAQQGFAQAVAEAVQTHAADFDASRIDMRASSGAKYLSLTCMVTVSSQAQLDDIYRTLSSHPMVKMVL